MYVYIYIYVVYIARRGWAPGVVVVAGEDGDEGARLPVPMCIYIVCIHT